MEITINNAIGLLKKCLANGEKGPLSLYAWFNGEKHLIETTISELESYNDPEAYVKWLDQ